MTSPEYPDSYGNTKSSVDFLRALGHRVLHLRRFLKDLRRLAQEGERILEEQSEAGERRVSPFIVRSASIVMLCAMVEGFVFDLAKAHYEIESPSKEPDSFRGSQIEKAKHYFKKAAGLRFPDQSSSWNRLKQLFLLRNAIVHNLGTVTDAGKRASVGKLPGVCIETNGEVWPKAELLPEVISAMEQFVDEFEEHLGGRQS